MKRATLALVAAFAAIVATAETSRTATENWTRKRIGEATNATLQAAKEYTDEHGGAGIDTNAVKDIIHATVDGAARLLPPYLHALDFDDSYPEEAAAYYRSRGDGREDGGCSARRIGGIVERNFDFPFDDRAEFVVRMSHSGYDTCAGDLRFASVGVANVGTNLTEAAVTGGRWSRYYKALPGATVDGINECGVCAEINVVGGDPQTCGWHTGGDIHPLGAVRWVLDHGTSAGMAASNLAVRVSFPSGWTQNFHYMIADERETWIVENGAAHPVTNAPAVMTNFRLYPERGAGEGQERYDLLLSCACCITNAWYTRAYRRETNPPWVSDLAKVIASTNDIFAAWETYPREHFRSSTNGWWQTVHTSVYDITNRTLRVAVQETDDWYTFAVPRAGGGVTAETDPVALPRVTALETEVAGIPRIAESAEHPGCAAYADNASAVGDYDEQALRDMDVYIGETIRQIDEEVENRASGDMNLDVKISRTNQSVATNAAVIASHSSQLSQLSQSVAAAAQSATNYTDAATNAVLSSVTPRVAELEAGVAAETFRATTAELSLQSQIDLFKSFQVIVTNSLPAVGEDGCVYLTPIAGQTNRIEWLWVHVPSDHWEMIGTTSIDMSQYYTRDAADDRFLRTMGNMETMEGILWVVDDGHKLLYCGVGTDPYFGMGVYFDNTEVMFSSPYHILFDDAGHGFNTATLGDLIDELYGFSEAHSAEISANSAAIADRPTFSDVSYECQSVYAAATNYTGSVLGPISSVLDRILGGH